MIINIPYKPHPLQKILHDDTHRFRIMVCGRRFGKTVFAVNELIKKALMKQGQYWYVAPFYGQAKSIAWLLFKKYAVDGIVAKKSNRLMWNESELSVTLINGSVIKLMGADKPDSLRGVGLCGVILDEFADFKRGVWDLVIRPTLSDNLGWALFLGTPKGKLNQLYEMFIKDVRNADESYRDFDGLAIEPNDDYIGFQFKTSDNPYIPKSEVLAAQKELSPAYFSQEYEASFENYTGIIYKEFDISKHIIDNVKLEPWWNYYIGIDTGRHSAVTFLAKDEQGVEYVFDEVYDYDNTVATISNKIRAKIAQWGVSESKYTFIIDSASQVKREYRENNFPIMDSRKDMENQIAQVRNRFGNDKLFFLKNCPMHIVEHQGYIWDERAKEPKPIKENDHTCSSLQYIFSTYHLAKAVDHEKIEREKQTLLYQTINYNTRRGNCS